MLARHWPDVPKHGDIKLLDGSELEPVLIAGGYPCQPFIKPESSRKRGPPPSLARVRPSHSHPTTAIRAPGKRRRPPSLGFGTFSETCPTRVRCGMVVSSSVRLRSVPSPNSANLHRRPTTRAAGRSARGGRRSPGPSGRDGTGYAHWPPARRGARTRGTAGTRRPGPEGATEHWNTPHGARASIRVGAECETEPVADAKTDS